METFEQRLLRFLDGADREFALNIRIAFENDLIYQIEHAHENWRQVPVLLLVGIHIVMQTISEYVFRHPGLAGTKFYLENFVDGDEPGDRFSAIAEELHEVRNVIAHRWSSALMHRFVFDGDLDTGWERRGDRIHFSLARYGELFLQSWRETGEVFNWNPLAEGIDMNVQRFIYLRDWLGLKDLSKDPIVQGVEHLKRLRRPDKKAKQSELIREMIKKRYLYESIS